MSTVTLTSRGQLTLPAAVRRALNLKAGDKVRFVQKDGGWRLQAASLPIQAIKGALPKPAEPLSLEAMEAAIADGGAGKP